MQFGILEKLVSSACYHNRNTCLSVTVFTAN